jgi:hypothetical protein
MTVVDWGREEKTHEDATRFVALLPIIPVGRFLSDKAIPAAHMYMH